MSGQVAQIIDHLNTRTGKKFSTKCAGTIKHIEALLAEGRTVDDFKHVIDVKASKWLGDPKMDDFLRPDTLFRPGHFESYLNERLIQPKAPAHLRIGAGSAPAPVTPEQKAERDRRVELACEEIDRHYGPLIEEARKSGDKAKIKQLAAAANQAREGRIFEIIYPKNQGEKSL